MSRHEQKFIFYKANGESHLIEGRDIFNAIWRSTGLQNEAKDFYTNYSATGDMPRYVYDEAIGEWVSNNNPFYQDIVAKYGENQYTTSVLKEEEPFDEELDISVFDVS